MNEYEYEHMQRLILVLTIVEMLNLWVLTAFLTRRLFSLEVVVIVVSCAVIGLTLNWVVSSFRRSYNDAMESFLSNTLKESEAMLKEAAVSVMPLTPAVAGIEAGRHENVVTEESGEPLVSPLPKNGQAPRWSVLQFRSYDDFMYGSFDAYVTKEEIVIRGRLKRGQPSLYMKIASPRRR